MSDFSVVMCGCTFGRLKEKRDFIFLCKPNNPVVHQYTQMSATKAPSSSS